MAFNFKALTGNCEINWKYKNKKYFKLFSPLATPHSQDPEVISRLLVRNTGYIVLLVRFERDPVKQRRIETFMWIQYNPSISRKHKHNRYYRICLRKAKLIDSSN